MSPASLVRTPCCASAANLTPVQRRAGSPATVAKCWPPSLERSTTSSPATQVSERSRAMAAARKLVASNGPGDEFPQPATRMIKPRPSIVLMGAPLTRLLYDTTWMNRRTFIRRGLWGGLLLAVGGSVGLATWPTERRWKTRRGLQAIDERQ